MQTCRPSFDGITVHMLLYCMAMQVVFPLNPRIYIVRNRINKKENTVNDCFMMKLETTPGHDQV